MGKSSAATQTASTHQTINTDTCAQVDWTKSQSRLPLRYMEHIGNRIAQIERNMKINSLDPVALHGFTQIPNFILRDPNLTIGAKTVYSLLLSYAWHNDLCFPGQETLAQALGMSVGSVNAYVKELEGSGLIEITRRGQGKTNIYTINFVVQKKPKPKP